MAQPLRVGVAICECDVTVRSDQIDCRAQQANAPHLWLPGEKVQRKVKFGADFGQTVSWLAIYVNLPRQ